MPALSSNSRRTLIQIARRALDEFVKTGRMVSANPEDGSLLEVRACFVTLRKKGILRGCVGTYKASRPLFEEVIQMTCAAAAEDFRFPQVRPEELEEIRIEISVLSPLERIHSPDEIEIGRHGIFLKWRDRSGIFLPEVGREMDWTAQELIEACAREKAGIPEKYGGEIELFRFTTEKIQEGRERSEDLP